MAVEIVGQVAVYPVGAKSWKIVYNPKFIPGSSAIVAKTENNATLPPHLYLDYDDPNTPQVANIGITEKTTPVDSNILLIAALNGSLDLNFQLLDTGQNNISGIVFEFKP